MSDTKAPVPYSEDNPNHVPNPLFQSGQVDTTGTYGDPGGRIEGVSPVFAQSRAQALRNAVDALDDPDVNENRFVVFPEGKEGQISREEAEARLREAAEEAEADPQLVNPHDTPAARQAAAETGEDGPDLTNAVERSKFAAGQGTDPGAGGTNLEGLTEVGIVLPKPEDEEQNGEGEGSSEDDSEKDADAENEDGGDGSEDSKDDEHEGDVPDGMPAKSASKAKWIDYNAENKLGVDESLNKDEFVAAVIDAAKAKAAAE